jgi:hypothetical protein
MIYALIVPKCFTGEAQPGGCTPRVSCGHNILVKPWRLALAVTFLWLRLGRA